MRRPHHERKKKKTFAFFHFCGPPLHKIILNINIWHMPFSYFKFDIFKFSKCQVTYGMTVGDMLHINFRRWGGHVTIDSAVGEALRANSY